MLDRFQGRYRGKRYSFGYPACPDLGDQVTLFRLLRYFWEVDSPGRPLLAFLCASARDPLLRVTAPAAASSR